MKAISAKATTRWAARTVSRMDNIKLPDEKEQRRVQEIIEELRHRSNEPDRTKVERDYIDRLLDQFYNYSIIYIFAVM